MRQVIKHRDIRLLNMIRRTDPEIPKEIFPESKLAPSYKYRTNWITFQPRGQVFEL